jgi:hypothetical protein
MQKTGKKTMGFRDKMAMVARRIGSLQYSVPEFPLSTPDVCMGSVLGFSTRVGNNDRHIQEKEDTRPHLLSLAYVGPLVDQSI